jgi:putative Ig domain-containing protein
MAAKTEWFTIRWRPRGLRPYASVARIDGIPEDQAPSWQLMCFASFFSAASLFLGVVCLIGCRGLATNMLATSAKSLTATTSSAGSPRITTVNFPAVKTQGQISPAANVVSFAPHNRASAPPKPVSAAPLRITKAILPVGVAQSDYDTALVARGGVPPYSWDATAGQIAPGLTLRSSAGTISGIPFAPGAFSFRVRVRDSAGSSLSAIVSLNVLGAPPTTVSDAVGNAGVVDGGKVMMISDRARVQQ